jgi:hypothetical protein
MAESRIGPPSADSPQIEVITSSSPPLSRSKSGRRSRIGHVESSWFTAGFVAWIIGSSITKIGNMPIYKWVADTKNTDPEELRRQRRRLGVANNWRAWITLASVILMACQFSVFDVAIVVALTAAVTPPLLWLASKYIPS